MSWFFVTIIAILCTVTYDYISKSILNKKEDHNPTAYAAAAFLSVTVCSAIVYVILGVQSQDFLNLFSPKIFPILLLDVILYTFAPSFYYRALKKLPLSEVAILYSLSGMFALGIGVMIGVETFLPIRFIGGIMIVLSVVLLEYKTDKWKKSKGIWYMLAATVFYACAALTDNQLIAFNSFSIFFLVGITFGVPGLFLLLVDKSARAHFPRMFQRSMLPSILLNAVFFMMSFAAVFKAYQLGGSTSQVNLLLSTQTIVTVVIAALFLNEKNDLKKKILAAILAGIGVYFLR